MCFLSFSCGSGKLQTMRPGLPPKNGRKKCFLHPVASVSKELSKDNKPAQLGTQRSLAPSDKFAYGLVASQWKTISLSCKMASTLREYARLDHDMLTSSPSSQIVNRIMDL